MFWGFGMDDEYDSEEERNEYKYLAYKQRIREEEMRGHMR
jgi:hypothetical protein